MKNRSTITSFNHYAPFLKARFNELKAQNPNFSHNYCARRIGATGSYLKHIFEGRRRIGLSRVSKIASVFRLSNSETQYFTVLVIRELVKDPQTRNYFSEVLYRLRFEEESIGTFAEFKAVDTTTLPLSNWLYGTLIELMSFPDFKDDDEWILSKLVDSDKITPSQVRSAIDDLLKHSVIERKEKGYRLKKLALSVPCSYSEEGFKTYRGILEKTWEVLGNAGKYARNHFLEAIAAVSSEDELKIFQAAEEYRDKVLKIAQASENPTKILVISNNLFNLVKRTAK